MSSAFQIATDLLEELRLRRWAREHYVPLSFRDGDWHPFILQEMEIKDQEVQESAAVEPSGRRIVPLAPDSGWTLQGPHTETHRPAILLRVPKVPGE